jgi:uncharacterized phage-associated protein
MVYDSLAIANYFLDLAQGSGTTISPMKIQKLVYYAHGWNLAISGVPLINEAVEAWEFGPVIPSIYHAFKKFGSGPITEKASKTEIVARESLTLLFVYPAVDDQETQDFLSVVWEGYRDLTAIQLSNLTHKQGSPWYKVYSENRGRRGVDIPDSLIKEYFESGASV